MQVILKCLHLCLYVHNWGHYDYIPLIDWRNMFTLGSVEVMELSGILLSVDLVEDLIEVARGACENYLEFSDDDIVLALDFSGLVPEVAIQLLEDFRG